MPVHGRAIGENCHVPTRHPSNHHVAISGTNQYAAGEEKISGLRFVNLERAASSRRFANISVKPSGMCCTTKIVERKSAGICDKTNCSAFGPPVEIPMAMTRRGGSVARFPFFGGCKS